MNMANYYNKFFPNRLLLFFGVLIISLQPDSSVAQESSIAQASSIVWIKQFTSADNDSYERSTTEKIVDFIMGSKARAMLTRPISILANDTTTIWVLDQALGNVFKFEDKLGDITHNRSNKYETFKSLVDICPFTENKFLFTDSYLNKIFVYNTENNEVISLNENLTLDQPTGICFSEESDEIWVVETGAHRIAILNGKGQLIKTIGARGTASGEFNFPTHICLDKAGKIFVVDALNYRIQIFSPEGIFLSSFGKQGDATGYFARPKGIATDSDGNIYIADALFHAVQIFDQTGKFLYTFGTQGHNTGEFWMPSGLFIDKRDYIYVADSYNSRVQVFKRIKGGNE